MGRYLSFRRFVFSSMPCFYMQKDEFLRYLKRMAPFLSEKQVYFALEIREK